MSEAWRGSEVADAEDVRGPRWEEAVAASVRRGAVVPAGGAADDDAVVADDGDVDLRRYARWQWRDFWRRRGGWLALGALLGVSLLALVAHLIAGESAARSAGDAAKSAAFTLAQVRGTSELFFTLGGAAAAPIGVGGLVSRERERGLQRFLFAKPVRPVRYYLQALAVNSAGALAVFAGAVLLAALVVGSAVPIASVLATGFAAYVLTAGVTFLVSTLVRFDAPVAAVWLLAGFPVYALGEVGIPGARWLAWLFPQGPAVALAKWATHYPDRILSPQTVVLATVLAALAGVVYGLLALAGGVAVLRGRAIST